ncbi:glycosyltransferase family 39 protein [Acidobacteriota bacterium]
MTSEKPKKAAIFLALILICAGFVIRILPFLSPGETLFERAPLHDDSFYCYTIARNIALGHGVTHDGVHPTNGFQPLFVFISVPFFAMGHESLTLPIRLIGFFQAFLAVLTGLLLFNMTRKLSSARGALVALGIWSLSDYFIAESVNGMETGLAFFFMLLSLKIYLKACEENSTGYYWILTGIFLGLSILSRVDSAVFAFSLGLHGCVTVVRRRSSKALIRVAAMTLVTMLIIAPWLIWNRASFGSWLPESGKATRTISLAYGMRMVTGENEYFSFDSIPSDYYRSSAKHSLMVYFGRPLLTPFSAMTYAVTSRAGTRYGGPLEWRWIAYSHAGFLVFFILFFRKKALLLIGRLFGRYYYLGLYAIFLAGAYSLYQFGQWWFFRYYFPVLALGLILTGCAYQVCFDAIKKRTGLARLFFIAVIALSLCSLLTVYAERDYRKFLSPQAKGGAYEHYIRAKFMREVFKPEVKLGSFQSGVASYLLPQHTVVGLDGVVNSQAFKAILNKKVIDYIKEEEIKYVVDWPIVVNDLLYQRSGTEVMQSLEPSLIPIADIQFGVFKVVDEE